MSSHDVSIGDAAGIQPHVSTEWLAGMIDNARLWLIGERFCDKFAVIVPFDLHERSSGKRDFQGNWRGRDEHSCGWLVEYSRSAESRAPVSGIQRISFRCFRMSGNLDAARRYETAMFQPITARASVAAASLCRSAQRRRPGAAATFQESVAPLRPGGFSSPTLPPGRLLRPHL